MNTSAAIAKYKLIKDISFHLWYQSTTAEKWLDTPTCLTEAAFFTKQAVKADKAPVGLN